MGDSTRTVTCGGGAPMTAHKGQSMLLPTTSDALPSAALTSIFIAPEPVQTNNISCGLTMGDATATPSDNTNHASTRRLINVKWRRVCIGALSAMHLTIPLIWVKS